MAKKIQTQEDQNLENVQEALTTSGKWIENNWMLICGVVAALIVVAAVVFTLKVQVWDPKSEAASDEVAKAVVYFSQSNYEVALNGDEADCEGFAAVADKYSSFKAGKLASLYAGICAYELGNYEDAVKYLKKYSAKDANVGPAAKMHLGDAYVALEEYGKAVDAFNAAAATGSDAIAPIALKKAGIVYLHEGKKAEAQKVFEKIKNDYKFSAEAQDIDKYIEMAK